MGNLTVYWFGEGGFEQTFPKNSNAGGGVAQGGAC